MLVLVHGRSDGAAQTLGLVAYALFATAIVFGIATISNDSLQDLKTGQIVGATPWRQQVALVIGVIFGGLVIPPILGLLNAAFGFAGAPGAGENALAAPQAALISSLAKGVFGGDLNWKLLALGVAIGAVVILIDEMLKLKTKLSLPPLAVGMGMYLPMSLTIVIPIGALLGRYYDKYAERTGGDVEQKKRLGVLMATGLIVGESLGWCSPESSRLREPIPRWQSWARASRIGPKYSAWCCSSRSSAVCTSGLSGLQALIADLEPEFTGAAASAALTDWLLDSGLRGPRGRRRRRATVDRHHLDAEYVAGVGCRSLRP